LLPEQRQEVGWIRLDTTDDPFPPSPHDGETIFAKLVGG
jgi:hypothetical protein